MRSIFIIPFIVLSLMANIQATIPHAIKLIIGPSGQKVLSDNLPFFIENSGLNLEDFYFPSKDLTLPIKTTREFSDNPEIQEIIDKVKETLERFITGIEINDHQVFLSFQEIEVNINWENIDFTIEAPKDPIIKEYYDFLVRLHLEVKDFNLNVQQMIANDLGNPWLGTYGLNDVLIAKDKESPHLRLSLPIYFRKDRNNAMSTVLMAPNHNFNDIQFDVDFKSPIIMPKITMNIDNYVMRVNTEEVEALIKEKEHIYKDMIKEKINQMLRKNLPEMINNMLKTKLDRPFREVNQMQPPGAPDNAEVAQFIWGIDLQDFSYQRQLLVIDLDANIEDPTFDKDLRLAPRLKAPGKLNLKNANISNYDFTFVLNQGLLNKVLQLSGRRQYFEEIPLAAGEMIRLGKTPELQLAGSRPHLKLEIEYEVEGFQSVFVKNPIHIEMNLLLDFPLDPQGKVQMIARGVDLNSVHVPSRYIHMFKNKVRKAVKKRIKEMNAGLNGFVLAPEVPIPTSLGGINLEKLKTQVDPSGNLLIYTNYVDEDVQAGDDL